MIIMATLPVASVRLSGGKLRCSKCKAGPKICDSVRLVQSTKAPQGRNPTKSTNKNTKSPTLGWAPKMRNKLLKNTWPKNDHFCFFPARVGDFVIFPFYLYFLPCGVFVLSTSPTESQPKILQDPIKGLIGRLRLGLQVRILFVTGLARSLLGIYKKNPDKARLQKQQDLHL